MASAKMVTYNVNGTRFEVDSRYQPINPVGKGAYGLVCSAQDLLTSKKVAIKKVPRAFDDIVDGKRILREIKLMKFCEHENICTVLDVLPPRSIDTFEDVYIVSDLMDTDLHQIVRSKQALSDDHVQYFLYQILRGLKYLHSANILHRDLKPGNLLVNANCDLKICDLGLARMMDPADILRDMTEYVVTRWYRPPELLLSSTAYTKSIDMWSVGCIFAELIARKPLFPGKNHVDQLNLITSIVGTPSPEELAIVTNEQALKFMKSMSFKPRVNLAARLPNCPATGVHLLEQMLQFDPRKRISVQDTLEHPYLATYHDAANEPVAKTIFKADFESIEMDKQKLRQLVWDEIESFRPELGQTSAGATSSAAAPVLSTNGTQSSHPSKRHRSDGPVPSAAATAARAPGMYGDTAQGQWVHSTGAAKPYGS